MIAMPNHHPGEELLLDYADGSLSEPLALVIATHLAFCPGCRHKVTQMEAIGGAFLEGEDPRPVSVDCLDAVMARLDEPVPPVPSALPVTLPVTLPVAGTTGTPAFAALTRDVIQVPEPLRSYVGAPLDALAWQPVTRGIDEVDLRVGRLPVRTRLVRIKAGMATPRHSHDGIELNLVLCGGFHDHRGGFSRGDVILDDATVDHRPIAEAGAPCICLTVTDAPLRLTGGLARFLNPFVRF